MTMMNNNLLFSAKNLSVDFTTDEGIIRAVDDISFSLDSGKTLGIVGESGSGKSVAMRSLISLHPQNAIVGKQTKLFLKRKSGDTTDISQLKSKDQDLYNIRGGEISMIFQEPTASFSPIYTIGKQISQAIRLHEDVSKTEARKRVVSMLDRVGITEPDTRFNQYSFELSGGMRQRAMIATALVTRPSILIADEPTTSLDVTIQAQVLKLMRDLQKEFGMGIIFISHDLGVISQVSDEICVMYLGKIVEQGITKDIINNPQHPYTKALLAAMPRLDKVNATLEPIKGDIPSPLERPSGCVFHTRCNFADQNLCVSTIPDFEKVGEKHNSACHLHSNSEKMS